ncbi:MAG: S41 family peptidase, partial [Gemmatimonadales bacterium]
MLLPMVLAALSLSGGALQQTRPDSSLTKAEKRLGVARVWAAVQQHYVNYDRLAIDWDSAFVAATAEAEGAETVLDYYRVLAGMVAAVGDGHTRISFPAELRAAELRSFALRTRLVEGRVIVTQVRNDSLYAAGVRPGMEVLEIDGETALAYGRRHVMPYQSSSTPQDRLLRTYDYELFRGPADEPVRLLLRTPDGDTLRVEGSRRLPRNRSLPHPLVEFRDLGNGTGYLALRSFGSSEFFAAFDSIYPRVLETERLVIDARDNGGGSSTYGYYVLSHLVDHPYQGTN